MVGEKRGFQIDDVMSAHGPELTCADRVMSSASGPKRTYIF
jgi:hypothetical protein